MNNTRETPGDFDPPRAARPLAVAVAVPDLKLRRQLLDALQAAALPVVDENCDSGNPEELLTSIERLTPDILFVGVAGLPADPAVMISRIAALDPAPRIVAVSEAADAETILKVIRAGASEFVYPPFTSTAFQESLQRVIVDCRRAPPEERSSGSVIGFVSAKGGCGATTLACHSASWLRREGGKEVLLADLDGASGIAGTIMRVVARYSLDDAVQNLHRMDLKLWKGLVANAPSGVDVLPSAPDAQVAGSIPLARKLPQLIRFWRMHYDVIVLDLGHGISQPLLEVLDSMDSLVLVATNEVLALRQAKQMIQALALRNFGANRLRLVVNRMPKRTQISIPELEKVMGHTIFGQVPNDYQPLNEAYSEPRLLEPDADLAVEIGQLAARLTGVNAPKKKSRGLFGFRGGG